MEESNAKEREKSTTPPPEPGSVALQVDEALSSELRGKVISIVGDFFVFEYVYKNHTRQYHETQNGELTGEYGGGGWRERG